MKRFKKLNPKQKERVANEVKMMVAAHRDCLWSKWDAKWPDDPNNKAVDPTKYLCNINDVYYGEAFGIMRGLISLGYGYFGSDNMDAVQENRSSIPEHNLKWWFQKLLKEYLVEEGWYDKLCTRTRCRRLLEKYQQLVRM